ncbi:MAG: Ig-like domain-containing domain, partial [Myxococcaceae bacterium]
MLCLLAACAPAIPSEERPKVLQVVFDPAVAELPTPNDLAMTGGKVAIGAQDRLSPAENELKLSFNGLEGFSTGSSARAQLTGPLSAASISEASLPALDLGEGGKGVPVAVPVVREYTPCDHSISLASPSGFLPGHVYLFAVRGGAAGLKGEAGEEVAASPAFHFLRAGKDLREHLDALPGATRAERQATAEKLEAVRGKLEPLFQILEKHGLPRREVAALWSFTAHSRGEPLFDPGQKKVPFPNALLIDPATGLVSLPIAATDSADSQALKRGFNKLDGFATTAALSVETTAPVERSSVTAATVRLFRADVVQEVMDVDRTLSADGKKVVLQPRSPLRPATPYVVVLAGVMDARANPLAPMPLASLLKLKNPLLDEAGESVISSVCTQNA